MIKKQEKKWMKRHLSIACNGKGIDMKLNSDYALTNIVIIDGKNNEPQKDMFLRIDKKYIREIGKMSDYLSLIHI